MKFNLDKQMVLRPRNVSPPSAGRSRSVSVMRGLVSTDRFLAVIRRDWHIRATNRLGVTLSHPHARVARRSVAERTPGWRAPRKPA